MVSVYRAAILWSCAPPPLLRLDEPCYSGCPFPFWQAALVVVQRVLAASRHHAQHLHRPCHHAPPRSSLPQISSSPSRHCRLPASTHPRDYHSALPYPFSPAAIIASLRTHHRIIHQPRSHHRITHQPSSISSARCTLPPVASRANRLAPSSTKPIALSCSCSATYCLSHGRGHGGVSFSPCAHGRHGQGEGGHGEGERGLCALRRRRRHCGGHVRG